MNRFWTNTLLVGALLSITSLGILGCGGGEPEPQSIDIDTAAIEEQAEAERAADAAEPGVAAPEGEPATSEGP